MYKQYKEKDKIKLVNEVITNGKSVADVATTHNVSISTLHRWVNEKRSLKNTLSNNAKCNQLASEIKVLTKERETLMHAMAIYAREFKE